MQRRLFTSLTKYAGFVVVAGITFFSVGLLVVSAFTVPPGTVTNPTFSPTEGNVILSPLSGSGTFTGNVTIPGTANIQGSITSTNITNDNNRHLIFSGFNNLTWDVYGGHGHGGFFGIVENNTITSPAFVIQAGTGNVGIGTTNPAYQLDIGGPASGIAFDGTTSTPDAGVIRFGDNSGWKLHFGRAQESAATSTFNTGTTGVLMTIQDNGNVGIGTMIPDKKLTVAGDAKIYFNGETPALLIGKGTGEGDTSVLRVLGDTSPEREVFRVTRNGNVCINNDCKNAWPSGGVASASASQWTTSDTSVYYNGGNVGIGTASPNKQLHVKTASGNAEIDIQSAESPYWAVYQDDATDQLRFWNNNFNRFVITTDGNVGIGTNPLFKLDVTGTARINLPAVGTYTDFRVNKSDGQIGFFVGNTGNVGIGTTGPTSKLEVLASGTDNAARLGNSQSNIDFGGDGGRAFINTQSWALGLQTAGTDRIYIANSGNVGIGTTDPKAKLDVNGDIRVGTHIIEAATGWPKGNYCIISSIKYGDATSTGACPAGFTETGMITDHQGSGGHNAFNMTFLSGGLSSGTYAAKATSVGSGTYQLKFCCK